MWYVWLRKFVWIFKYSVSLAQPQMEVLPQKTATIIVTLYVCCIFYTVLTEITFENSMAFRGLISAQSFHILVLSFDICFLTVMSLPSSPRLLFFSFLPRFNYLLFVKYTQCPTTKHNNANQMKHLNTQHSNSNVIWESMKYLNDLHSVFCHFSRL